MEKFQQQKENEKQNVTGNSVTKSSKALEKSKQIVTILPNPEVLTDQSSGSQTRLAGPISQVDGLEEEDSHAIFAFNSDYVEEDIIGSFCELFPGNVATLSSRVRVKPLSADHLCTVDLHPVPKRFFWPVMDPENMKVFREVRRIK